MKENLRRVPARLAPANEFDLANRPNERTKAATSAAVEALKTRLFRERLAVSGDPRWATFLRRAANEAAALAWLTECPLLILPTLLDEKAEAARHQLQLQDSIRRRSQAMICVAA